MMTSLPSSPAPRSMTFVAVGDSGVPRRGGMFIIQNPISHKYGSRSCNNLHGDNTKPCRFWTEKNKGILEFIKPQLDRASAVIHIGKTVLPKMTCEAVEKSEDKIKTASKGWRFNKCCKSSSSVLRRRYRRSWSL